MVKYKGLKKNDNIKVIAGKDIGKLGKVLIIDRKKGKVLIEGINMVKKTMRKTKENPNGGIKDIEAFFNISNVQLICPKCKKSTRVGIKKLENKKVRMCKKCSAEIE